MAVDRIGPSASILLVACLARGAFHRQARAAWTSVILADGTTCRAAGRTFRAVERTFPALRISFRTEGASADRVEVPTRLEAHRALAEETEAATTPPEGTEVTEAGSAGSTLSLGLRAWAVGLCRDLATAVP